MSDSELNELIAQWLEGRLGAQGSHALQEELLGSAAARSLFRKHARLDCLLHEAAESVRMLKLSEATQGFPGKAAADASERCTFSTRSEWERSPGRPLHGIGFVAACAAALLLAASMLNFRPPIDSADGSRVKPPVDGTERDLLANSVLHTPPAPIATLSSSEAARWKDSPRRVGEAFYERETISLTTGKARISVGFGAEIVADGPFSLTFTARDKVRLHHGQIAVDVAPWAKGFTVVTPDMDVVDLGTTFTVSASPGERSKATVLKGVVRVHPSTTQEGAGRGVLISEGEQISINIDGLIKGSQSGEVKDLLRKLDFGTAGRYRPLALHNTGFGLCVGDEDLHWKAVAGPGGHPGTPQYATVCLPHKAYLPNEPDNSQWVSIADWRTAKANSTYTFRSEFDLSEYDTSTILLFGRILADNGVSAVRVNGSPVPVQSWIDNDDFQPFDQTQFRFVNVTDELMQGTNIIEIDVRNGMQRTRERGEGHASLKAIPNPMALRVEWHAFGRCRNASGGSGPPDRLLGMTVR